MPSKTLLEKAYRVNHDGCGFVSTNDYFKSLDFETFYKRLLKVKLEDNCIIHFRWATTGSVCRRNCHPFYDKKTGVYFAHNGVLPYHPTKDITDSEKFFRCSFLPNMRHIQLGSEHFSNFINYFSQGQRYAVMKDNKIYIFGQFYDMNGILYSNLRFIY